jgi:hypothetical protein
MTGDQDHYEAYYADKLWNLLPAVYRALDTDQYNTNGPLRELVNRIGAQAATLRRSIDRMWEDQSIETCDDWIIPYIGDLVATNLVVNLDTRGQRLDVAKTIYYRRRKGTVAIFEEIAADITGWNAKVVEFFRRLGRTRHGLDPALGLASIAEPDIAALQQAEGLVGPLTGTGIGGLADIRNVYGASKAGSAFDEFFHTADFRLGQGQVGWYDIPRLGVFLWRLQSFGVDQTTPVESVQCPGQFTFDPTGRDIPLFGVSSRSYGTNWTSPSEWQLPTPITGPLLGLALTQPAAYPLYAVIDPTNGSVIPNALGVYRQQGTNFVLLPASELTADPATPPTISSAGFYIDPRRGRIFTRHPSPAGALRVSYHYGFPSTIGAGPYDRRAQGYVPASSPAPVTGGGSIFAAKLVGLAPSGTVTIGDFLTYTSTTDVGSPGRPIGAVTIGAENTNRPLIRLPATPSPGVSEWVFTSGDSAHPGQLVLDGLFISGGDLVLRGSFETVALRCCTLDPGGAATVEAESAASRPASVFAVAADGRELVPCHLWIEGTVSSLTVDRCITGPIRTRGNGQVATLTITNSIIQAIPTGASSAASVPFSASIPPEMADTALAFTDGDVCLSRCTVLGPVAVHRLEASECILRDLAQVDDTQDGCVRFSAWAAGSVLPRQYESVQIAPGAELFTSTDFGQPGYCQLLQTVDMAILPGAGVNPSAPPTIAAGGENESEMGAYARDLNPVRASGLLIKFQEYMPAGLVPVLIYVT